MCTDEETTAVIARLLHQDAVEVRVRAVFARLAKTVRDAPLDNAPPWLARATQAAWIRGESPERRTRADSDDDDVRALRRCC
jgi:hypothetical protein